MTACPIEPLADRVVVVPVTGQKMTRGGLYLPDRLKPRKGQNTYEGVVAAVGTGVAAPDGTASGSRLAPGDHVVYRTLLGKEEWWIEGVCWTVISEVDVLAKVEGSGVTQ